MSRQDDSTENRAKTHQPRHCPQCGYRANFSPISVQQYCTDCGTRLTTSTHNLKVNVIKTAVVWLFVAMAISGLGTLIHLQVLSLPEPTASTPKNCFNLIPTWVLTWTLATFGTITHLTTTVSLASNYIGECATASVISTGAASLGLATIIAAMPSLNGKRVPGKTEQAPPH